MPEVTIIGGGIAGLSLGIMLAKAGCPSRVIESGNYPRHKVCGEFLSGNGLSILHDLDVPLAGAAYAKTVLFCDAGKSIHKNLPVPALCLSRYNFDNSLATKYRGLGGNLQTGTRWTNNFDNVIRATGRRLQQGRGEWRWLGLKAHAFDVDLNADLEMHFGPNSYVGLCRIEDGKTNVCGLFRSRLPWTSPPEEILRGALFGRFKPARFEQNSFCSVTGFAFKETLGTNECAIGDAFGMIPPFTGNGLSLALESAALAFPAVNQFAEGQMSWNACIAAVNDAQKRAFNSRVIRARLLQKAMFSSLGKTMLFHAIKVPSVWQKVFASTRSGAFSEESDALVQDS